MNNSEDKLLQQNDIEEIEKRSEELYIKLIKA